MCLEGNMIIIFQRLSEAPEMKQGPNNTATSEELNCLFILKCHSKISRLWNFTAAKRLVSFFKSPQR